MTQALLNNLNILKDDSFNYGDKSLKAVVSDFEKILDSKTNSDISGKKSLEAEQEVKNDEIINDAKAENQKTQDTSNNKEINKEETAETTKNVSKTIGDLKKEILQNNIKNQILDFSEENKISEEVLAEEIDNLILEESAEIYTEQTVNTEDSEKADNNSETEAKAEQQETEQEDTEETVTQDTNITEEDSTMYKEMNAPENPTTVLLLSQIQTTVKMPVSDNTGNTEHEAATSTSAKKSSNDNTLDVQINKQFDDILSKDMPIVSSNSKSTANTATEQPKQSTVLNEKIVKELNIESVNAEPTQNPSSGDLMQNQTPQEQTVKIMIQGEIKSEVNIALTKTAEVKPTEITPSKIIEQISKQLEGMYNNSKLEMVLNPGTLGKLHLHLMNTKEGLIAQFTVTTQEAKDLLMKGLNGLKEALLAQGVSVDTVSVKLEESDSDTGFDWDEKEGSQGGHKQQGTRKQKDEKKPFEQMMFEIENDDNLV